MVQLEDADLPGALDMRPSAQVGKRPLRVVRDRLAFRQVVDQLRLEVLPAPLFIGDRLFTRLFGAGEREVIAPDPLHPRLDLNQILGRQ